uniref:Uncharacterized protein n=1 Tax=Otolemur garnettii TaxID=30611 RepID=H0Y0D5_OTOGA
MSYWAPCRLVDLATQHLLRNQDLAISAVEQLPEVLFPVVFEEVYRRQKHRLLTAMVQAWPFTYLPLGRLMVECYHLKTLKAVLDGLDGLLAQEVRPSTWKLQVVDLWHSGEHFWNRWYGTRSSSSEWMSKQLTQVDCPRDGGQRPLTMIIQCGCSWLPCLTQFLAYVFEWAQHREDRVHLCCRKIVVTEGLSDRFQELLNRVDLNCIQDLTVYNLVTVNRIDDLGSYVARMKSLRQVRFHNFHIELDLGFILEKETDEPAFRSGHHRYLVQLDLEESRASLPPLFERRLKGFLSCLPTSLESLVVMPTSLSESELEQVVLCPTLRQLRKLDLTGVYLSGMDLKPLGLLLEDIAATLQILVLRDCEITDNQLGYILPGLSRSHQLVTFDFCGNHLRADSLARLLRHTGALHRLSLEIYPIPRDYLGDSHPSTQVCWESFLKWRVELMDVLRNLRTPRRFVFKTHCCSFCGARVTWDLDMMPQECLCSFCCLSKHV